MGKNDSLIIFGLLGALVLGAGGMALVSGLFKRNGSNGTQFFTPPPYPDALRYTIDFKYPDLTALDQALTDTGDTISGKYRGWQPDPIKGAGLTDFMKNGVLVSKVDLPLHESLEEAITGLSESRIGLESSKEALETGSREAKRSIRKSRAGIISGASARDILEQQMRREFTTSAIKRLPSVPKEPWVIGTKWR